MKRIERRIDQELSEEFKLKLLSWSSDFQEVAWLDSNQYHLDHSSFEAVLAVDAFTLIQTDTYNAFDDLNEYFNVHHDWIFGFLAYDLKNDVEALSSTNHDGLEFPDLYFFQPKKLIFCLKDQVVFSYLPLVADEIDSDFGTIMQTSPISYHDDDPENSIAIRLRTSKDSYHSKIREMLAHIERGDIYEANFCQEFFAENAQIDPIRTFMHLNEISKPPFATYLRFGSNYVLSASPERYLRREGDHVLSQPIKGTARRDIDPEADKGLLEQLRNDPKERSENIMITDLVRNDLSRFAIKGSVAVDELCGIYTFEQVHQMISTVSCEVPNDVNSVDMIRNTFPMGSMTGAPKISAMKIIEELEDARRGVYSGAIGYFTPEGDFDFNVVIRSILYNEQLRYVSYSVGGAITAKSIPEKEYEECLLKAKAMRSVLEK